MEILVKSAKELKSLKNQKSDNKSLLDVLNFFVVFLF